MNAQSAEFAVVGTGVTGLLVADALARAGHEVALLERGARRSHADQVSDGVHALPVHTAEPNHEAAPGARDYPWTYVYGVGGSTLAWAGVATRFAPSDFTLATSFGVGRDWPVGYDELVPYYERAELALGVAGEPGTQHPQPLSPVDTLLAPHLSPYHALAQARPTQAAHGRPACAALARCELCPVDARYSALHTLADSGLEAHAGVTVHERTLVTRLRLDGARAQALECMREDGERFELRAGTVVLAANGLENPGLLLRSGLDGPDVGRWLFDHEHRIVEARLDVPAGHGYGATPATGISYAFAREQDRSGRGAVLALPVNPGIEVTVELLDRLADGERGQDMRQKLRDRFTHTLVLDTTGEDLPRPDRRVELSPRRDRFGVPLNRVHYGPDSSYLETAYDALPAELEDRLAPLGARVQRVFTRAGGAHLLGTCFMGESSGVVDPDLRHHGVENLYVAGGSAFPTYSAAHPTLTIAALALRLGEHLAAG